MGFLDMAKQGFDAYEAAQQRSHQSSPAPNNNQDYNSGPGNQQRPSGQSTGAAAEYYNESPSAGNQSYGGGASHGYGQGGLSAPTGNDIYNKVDHSQAIQGAAQHSGDDDSSVYSTALNHMSSSGTTPSLDHQAVEDAHQQAYQKGNAGSLDASSMGSAAAMQAFKLFTGGGSSSSAGGGSSQLVSLAMGEAVKLFNSSGGPSTGGKQDVVNSAVKTVMKLMLQSKMGGGSSGGGPDLSSLMGMASKFF